jgi:hypothetical protein
MIEPAPESTPGELPLAAPPNAELRPVMAGVHLVFVPNAAQAHWLLWGNEAAQNPLAVLGEPGTQIIPDETFKVRRVRGYRIP